MRLVDADLLLAEGRKRKMTAVIPEYQDLPEDTKEVLGRLGATMKKIILAAPTIDAVIMPCPLGTTLYRIVEERNGRKPFIRVTKFNRSNFCRIVFDGEMGKTVFLSREEAEAAIADRR